MQPDKVIKGLNELVLENLSFKEQFDLMAALLSVGNQIGALQELEGEMNYKSICMGYCHYCGKQSVFQSNNLWLRDYLQCTNCGSIPRQRNLVRTLDELIPAWSEKMVHESSPADTRFSSLTNYSSSFFFPNKPLGAEIGNNCTVQNLEDLTFPDNTFDIFITQDVLEHVFDPGRALNEVMRVLKPGGWHVFSTPRDRTLGLTVQRAKMENGSITHLLEPVYHGNPIDVDGALVTFDWGVDFEVLAKKWTGYDVLNYSKPDMNRGILGEMFETFAIQKAG